MKVETIKKYEEEFRKLIETNEIVIKSKCKEWGCEKEMEQLKVFYSKNRGYVFEVLSEVDKIKEAKKQKSIKDALRDALLRCGAVNYGNFEEVVERLKSYDDIILGFDTNILLSCTYSSVLSKAFMKSRYPNWILIIIPKIAMAEIEEFAAEVHRIEGRPLYRSRIGRRALQEVIELDTSQEEKFTGMSVMVFGQMPTNYKEIRGNSIVKDSLIRQQFREFLGLINFHKGAFFLSEDKVNVMMALAEGLCGLYLQKPVWEEILGTNMLQCELWRLFYELSVSFDEITLYEGDKVLYNISIFWPGKHVSDWEEYKVLITGGGENV